jgi:hypothetical protein
MNEITFRVSEKKAVSVYGLGRFPVTLYAEQWARLLEASNVVALQQFIDNNREKLSHKTASVANG